MSTSDLEKIREISAEGGMTRGQKSVLIALLTTAVVFFLFAPIMTLKVIVTIAILNYAVNVAYKVYIMCHTSGGSAILTPLPEDYEYPVYTILAPVRGEEAIINQLIRNLMNQDYPHDKLQVFLIVDEDDKKTCQAAEEAHKPFFMQVVVVPDSWEGPRGKPRAMNYVAKHGMIKGKYTVVYDGEDAPEPDQLKKAAAAFELYPHIDCFQAVLRWWNENQNWYTRMIALSYANNFNSMLRGLAATGGIFPLGGTSNHIRTRVLVSLDFWDEFNVTEDFALGVAMALAGYKCMILPSITWEEATTNFTRQAKQNSRWIKGHTATAIAFTKDPIFLARKLGLKGLLSFYSVVFAAHPAMIAAPLFWAMTTLYALTSAGIIREITPSFTFYMGTLCLLTNAVFLWTAGLALLRSGQFKLWPWIFTLPIYWVSVLTMGSLKAVYEVFSGRLYYWDKTEHGLVHRKEEHTVAPALVVALGDD